MRKYFKYKLQNLVQVKNIVTIEYLELFPYFNYEEESHNFWELIYVDSGIIECKLNNEIKELSQGEVYLVPPSTSHLLFVNAMDAPSVFIVCFESDSKILNYISSIKKLKTKQIELISDIMNETKGTFRLPFKQKLTLIDNPNIGGQQLIKIYFEQLLILLLRDSLNLSSNVKFFMTNTELENHVVNEIVKILRDNLHEKIDMDYICKQLNYSATYLNSLCKKHINYTVMYYFTLLKITEAKKMLRKNKHNITEISSMLNFDNSNYFTKVFKKYTSMTPSQYKKSIKTES